LNPPGNAGVPNRI